MSSPRQSSITKGLLFGFCILISIFLLFGVYTLYDIHRISQLSRIIYKHPLVVSNAALQANVSIAKIHRNMKDVVLFHSLSRIQQSIEAVNEEEKAVYRSLNIVRNNILGEEGKDLENTARSLFEIWQPIRRKVIGFVREGRREKAAQITIGEGADHVALLEDKMLGLTNYARNKASEFARETEKVHSRLNLISILFLIMGVLTSLLVALWTLKRTKFTEKSLLESEERYRSLIEDQTDLVCRIKPDGKFVFVNDMYCQFSNKSKKELIGAKWEPLFVDDDIQLIKEKFSTLSPANPTVIIENRVHSGKDQIHWMQFINSGIFDHQGDLLEIQSVGRDITERKQVEEALKKSEKFSKDVIDSMMDGFSILDKDGVHLDVNKSFSKITGYNKEELIGIGPPHPYWPEEEYENIQKAFEKTTQGVFDDFELVFKKNNGERFPVIVSPSQVKDDKGNVIANFASIKDITERKQAEEALRESEKTFQIAMEATEDGLYDWNLVTNEIYYSPGWKRMLGYDDTELPNDFTVWEKLTDAKDVKRSWKLQNELINKKRDRFELEFKMKHKDGHWVYILSRAKAIFDKDGKAIRIVGTHVDISELKEMEEKLRQAQKMESIGNLAGGIAHDFNNILSSVIGFTELALDDVDRGTPLEDNLQEVFTASKRARDLVKQILAFARQSDEERKPIRVDIIAKEVLKLIRSTIPTSIKIKESIECNSLIMGNPSQVHQLFMNLCTNAAQEMEDTGGILEVRLTDIELDERSALPLLKFKSGNYMKITISDTGHGIAQDILGSIFEPYFTTKGVGEGTGMGLALAHGIVESYGGQITVESELGKGTVFSIYLPITKKREDYHPYEKEILPSGTEKILFVDDEFPIAKMGRQILERLRYRVTVRTSSVEALELFRSRPNEFDLVISDMTMPNMTGDELAMELIALRADIPVILCTGYSKKITDEKASKIGIKAFAYKPMVKADLAKTVRKVLDDAKNTAQQ